MHLAGCRVKEQLHLFAAMEQDVMQRLEGGMFVDETVSHEALLRNVGCARMRAALLNRVAEQVWCRRRRS